MNHLSAFREQFEPILKDELGRHVAACVRMADDPSVASSIEYAQKLMQAGGKRIRPYFASLGYRCVGGLLSPEVLRKFVALEIFQLFALIHDDVMDEGVARHGIPTAHVAIASRFAESGREGDVARAGMSHAILLGNLLLRWSLDAFESGDARRVFLDMVEEVNIGQMLDIDLATRPGSSFEIVTRKMLLKTARYTFTRPLQIGAALAEATRETREAFMAFGDAVGLAFQTQDDLFDLTLTRERSGKMPFSDLRERQHTFFTQYILEQGTAEQRDELMRLFGAELSEADRPRIERLFHASGAFDFGRQEIARFFEQAERALKHLPGEGDVKQELADTVAALKTRSM